MITVPFDIYCHPLDKKTLDALKAVPFIDSALKKVMAVFSENLQEGLNMASKIRLGPEQLPEIYNLLPPTCATLGIEEPQFYLEMNPEPNAYTNGDTKIAITLTSGLVNMMSNDELRAVIAHECGHIACHHVLYYSMASLLLDSGVDLLGLGMLIELPLKLALYKWQRCSELSADRAAAIVMGGSESVENTMMKLSGGLSDITLKMNKELYLRQAEAYLDMIDNSKWNKIQQYYLVSMQDHPLTAVRAYEINKWCKSDDFARIINYMN